MELEEGALFRQATFSTHSDAMFQGADYPNTSHPAYSVYAKRSGGGE